MREQRFLSGFLRPIHAFYPWRYGSAQPAGVPVPQLVSEPTFSGCAIVVRPIDLLTTTDDGRPGDKVLAVPVREPEFASVQTRGGTALPRAAVVKKSRISW